MISQSNRRLQASYTSGIRRVLDIDLTNIVFMLFILARIFSNYSEGVHRPLLIVQALTMPILLLSALNTRKVDFLAILVFVLYICIAMLVDSKIVGTASYSGILQLAMAFTAGLYLHSCKIDRHLTLFVYLVLAIILLVMMLNSTTGYYLFHERLSRNYISIFLIISICVIAVSVRDYHSSGMRYLLLAAIVMVFVSIVGRGRAGIISSILLLAMLTYVDIRNKRDVSKALVMFLEGVILLAVGYLMLRSFLDEGIFDYFGSSVAERSDLHREDMLRAYIGCLIESPIRILLGFNPVLTGNHWLILHEGNLHNSFLQLHANFGLLPLVLIFIAYIKLINSSEQSGDKLLAVCITVFLVRALTDRVFPFSYGDFLVFYILLEAFMQKKVIIHDE